MQALASRPTDLAATRNLGLHASPHFRSARTAVVPRQGTVQEPNEASLPRTAERDHAEAGFVLSLLRALCAWPC